MKKLKNVTQGFSPDMSMQNVTQGFSPDIKPKGLNYSSDFCGFSNRLFLCIFLSLWFFILNFVVISPVYAMAGSNSIHETILNNGLTIIYKQNRASQMVIMDMFIKGGIFYEDEDKSGITNLVGKLLLKGTINRSAEEISREIEFMGGSINTEVANDFAEVWLIIPKRSFRQGLNIFADVLKAPVFPQDEIEKERKVVLAQLKSQKDDIFTYTYNVFIDELYNTFPYHRPVLGYEETVGVITREDMVTYHRDFYAPNNMILVIMGNLSFKEVLSAIDEEFGGILPVARTCGKTQSLTVQGETFTITKESPFRQAYLMLGYLAPEVSSPDYPSMKLINMLLGGRASSKIYVQLREKMGLAYELGSFYPSRKYQSQFVVYIGLSPDNIAKAKENIIKEILKLSQCIPEQDLLDAKSSLIGKFILDHQTLRKQAWYLGWFEVMGKGWQYDEKYPKEITNLTPDAIKRSISTYLKENNWVCVEVIPATKQN